jgi:hypothetical protein
LEFSIKCQYNTPLKNSVVELAPQESRRVYLPYGKPKEVWTSSAEYDLRDAKTGRVIIKNNRGGVPRMPLDDSLSVMTEFDFYSRDKAATVLVRSRAAAPITFQLKVMDANAESVDIRLPEAPQEVRPQEIGRVTIDISSLQEGEYKIIAEAKDVTGRAYVAETHLRKLPPGKNEVRMSRLNGALFHNASPILPYCFAGTFPDDAESHGFNAQMGFGIQVPAEAEVWEKQKAEYRKQLDDLHARGKRVILHVNPEKEGAERALREFLDHPAIIANNYVDEPYGRKKEEMVKIYAAGKKINPYQPLYINWGQEWEPGVGGSGSLEATDIASLDYYPFGSWCGKPGAGVVDVARWTERMKDDSRLMGRVIGFWNQTYGFDDAWRSPSPDEARAMTYISLINGVRLFYYFTGRPASFALWEQMREIGHELKALEPYLIRRECREITSGIVAHGIRYALWDSPSGRCFIACNPLAIPLTGSFDLGKKLGLQEQTAIVLFEERKVTLSEGILNEEFGPFSRHVYCFEK